MLYRHFKGGIYYLHGFVQATASKLLVEKGEEFAKAYLIQGDDLEMVEVLLIRDRRTDFTQFIIEKPFYGREYCLYQNLDGIYWLREKKEFFGNADNGFPRFERLTEERIFTCLIAEKMGMPAEGTPDKT